MNIFRIMILTIIIACNGCVSGYVLQNSKSQIGLRMAIQSDNENAVKSIKEGVSPKAFDIEISTWEAIKERYLIQIGALVADALILWGGVESVQWISDQKDDGKSSRECTSQMNSEESNDKTYPIQINGDNNTVYINGDAISNQQ